MANADDCLLAQNDKKKLRGVVKSMLPSNDKPETEAADILPITGRGNQHPYNEPTFNKAEAIAMKLYNDLLCICEDNDTIDEIKDEMSLLRAFVRVREYTDKVNAMLPRSARDEPVTRSTGRCVNYTCKCDRYDKGIVRVSGCVKCCVNMPVAVSECRCQQHFNVWPGYETADLICNHAGEFDAIKFAMMFFNTHICSICSEQTDGHCQHLPLAVDAAKLYSSGVTHPTDIDYVKDRISKFEDREFLSRCEVWRIHYESSRSKRKNPEKPFESCKRR
jgi:hypothetical protein